MIMNQVNPRTEIIEIQSDWSGTAETIIEKLESLIDNFDTVQAVVKLNDTVYTVAFDLTHLLLISDSSGKYQAGRLSQSGYYNANVTVPSTSNLRLGKGAKYAVIRKETEL